MPAVAASRSGLLDEDEEKAGGADDADDGWTPGQRPSRRYAPLRELQRRLPLKGAPQPASGAAPCLG